MLYSSTILILLSFFLGYKINITSDYVTRNMDKVLTYFTLGILLCLGYELGSLDDVATQLQRSGRDAFYLFVLIMSANCGCLLLLLDNKKPGKPQAKATKLTPLAIVKMLLGSCKYIGFVILGLVLAVWMQHPFLWLEQFMSIAIIILLFLVGMGVRSCNIPLKTILLNKMGLRIAALVMLSSLVAGGIFSYFMPEIGLSSALALSSGFGWYTLSGILIGYELGPYYGSIAFILDLTRELVALLLIPIFFRYRPATAIGSGGATALDFTLPVIEQSCGKQYVPAAISSGFILTVISPVMISLFLLM